ncbi:MAG TPA: formate dehydrogenase accessory protein FdhE [Methylomirabilota bacterium]
MSSLTRDLWLEAHAYLRPVATLCARVESLAAAVVAAHERPALPAWTDYADDFREGIPLLRSPAVAIDLEPVGRMTESLAGRVADAIDGALRSEAAALATELRARPDAPRLVAAGLLGEEAFELPSPGLLRYLGWTVTSRYLASLVEAFGRWRDEERWHRKYCPTCGSAPAMGQLVGVEPGRQRFLSCGACGSRWRYRRTQCPFCENDPQQLSVLAVQGEAGLRIDYCEACKGYLKTYDGQGDEAVQLLDWTSIHLDLVARDRGLIRMAASLYELPA